jgi:hypothetical protein
MDSFRSPISEYIQSHPYGPILSNSKLSDRTKSKHHRNVRIAIDAVPKVSYPPLPKFIYNETVLADGFRSFYFRRAKLLIFILLSK